MPNNRDESLGSLALALGMIARRGATGSLTFSDASGQARLGLDLQDGHATGLSLRDAAVVAGFDETRRAAFHAAARAAAAAGARCRFEESASRGPRGPRPSGAPGAASDLAIEVVASIDDQGWMEAKLSPEGSASAGALKPADSPPAVPPASALTSQLGFLLSRVDGRSSIREIVDASPLGPLDTIRGLFALFATGMIDHPRASVAAAAPPARAAAPAPGASPPARPGLTDLDRFLARTAEAPARAAATASRWDEEQQKERDDLASRCRAIDGVDHYGVLGLARGATEAQVRAAYYALARQYHPDRMHRPHLADLQGDLEKMFASITVAYSTLSRADARSAYDRDQSAGGHGRPADSGMDRAQVARDAFLRGRKHLDAGQTYEALRLFELAVEKDPRRAEYLHFLGICQGKNPRWRKKAEETLNRALEINPGSIATLMELARLYHKGGLERKAVQVAERILKWDPGNVEALAIAGLGKDRASGPPGLLKGLFNKD